MLYLDQQWLMGTLGGVSDYEWAVLRDPRIYLRFCALNKLVSAGRLPPEQEHLLVSFVSSVLKPGTGRQSESAATAEARIADLRLILKQKCSDPWRLGQLAELAGMSPFHLIRKFRAQTGMTPHAYLLDTRINRAKALLREGRPLVEVAYRLQFADQSHFQRVFKRHVAATPKSYCRAA